MSPRRILIAPPSFTRAPHRQGRRDQVLRRTGYGDVTDALTLAFDKLTVCTAATGCLPPIDLKAPPDPETNKVMAALQPAIVLSGPVGTKTIAPYGMPNGISAEFKQAGIGLAIGAVAATVGAVLLIRSL